jgi:molybdopterin-synthase adenylyltransferase
VALTDAEVERYARQLTLPGFGEAAQEQIRAARVHVVGAGALAGPALLWLAQSGVGTIYVDDGADVGAGDADAWLYSPDEAGRPRLFGALEATRQASAFVTARPHGTIGSDPTAVLICAPTRGFARLAAERARVAGLVHVVALAEGEGGEVVSVPSGAPCYSCGSRPGAGTSPRSGAAAVVGLLGALELLLLVGGIVKGPGSGRRIDLTVGQPQSRATVRVPGCDCANVY